MRGSALLLAALFLGGCATHRSERSFSLPGPLSAAGAVIDAFYSFDRERLRLAMAGAEASMPQILYYQGWAEGGNYVVLERTPCRRLSATEVACDIKVRDDLIQALGTGYDVTDTFHFTFVDDRLTAVRTSSNDPPEFEQALGWLRETRPELLTGPCRGFFAGGPTPQACVRAVVSGFRDFARRAN